jgi:hypothetical protein
MYDICPQRIETLYALLAIIQNQTLGGFRQPKL